MRMCAICRQRFPKRSLVRLAKTSDGQVSLDETGKKPGRGFYVCQSSECLAQATKGSRLEKAVGVKIDGEVLAGLKEKAEHES
jgi:predicted RNA-binding protein YlxR (DUF448 family)